MITKGKEPDNSGPDWPDDARTWTQKLREYGKPDSTRGIRELLITSIGFIVAWCLLLLALRNGLLWLYMLLLLPAGGFLVRLFAIQHDCGHGSFLRSKRANDYIGRILGVLTLTPYHTWRYGHAIHHATSGNLDRRGYGDVDTLTVSEYLARSRWGRLRYRLYRHPLVMFGVGPFYHFLFRNRLPIGFMRSGWKHWMSTMATNFAIAVFVALAAWAIGLEDFLLVHLPAVLLAGAIGIWLFYVQHQFSETTWARDADWDMPAEALTGSSHYDLPRILRWFTANIGLHHVHHLSSRIPFYRLPEVLRDYPELQNFGRVTFLQSLRAIRLSIWDEERQQLISLRELSMSNSSA